MEFVKLERKPVDEKGAIAIEAEAAKQSVGELLEEFRQTIVQAKNLEADATWEDVDAAGSQAMGVEAFRELKRDFVVNHLVAEAMRQLEIHAALTPKIHVLEYPDASSDYRVDLSVVEQPQLRLSSYEPVTVHADMIEVTDMAVATRVADVLDRYATYEDADPKPIAMGDVVLVDVDTQQDDQLVGKLSGKHRVLAMDQDAMPKPFLEGIVGMEVGETRKVEFAVPRPRGISEEDVDRYISTVTMIAQQRKIEVELTDEWVRAHYPSVENVEAFFEEARKDVAFDIDNLNRDRVAHLANVELEKRLLGSIPDEFYQASYRNLMDKFERDLAKQGKTLDDYYEEEKTNEQELSVKMLIQSGESLKQGFALEALFDGRSMELTDEEISDAAARFFGDRDDVETLERKGRLKLVQSMAKRSKAMAWLVETANVLPE